MDWLRTARLILQPLTLADAPAIQREFPHWEIVRLMAATIPWPYPDDGALSYLEHIALPKMAAGEGWYWSLRPLDASDTLIGVISLMLTEDDNRGFWIARDWQRQGLMTEAADVVSDYWFNVLGQTVMRIPKAIDNPGSRRISERTGARVIRTEERMMVCGPVMAEIWEITASEWRAYRQV